MPQEPVNVIVMYVLQALLEMLILRCLVLAILQALHWNVGGMQQKTRLMCYRPSHSLYA
jgi:hypothetical protein